MASRNLMVAVAWGFFLSQLLISAHADHLWAAETSTDETPTASNDKPKGVTGIAYYYSKRYNGKRTNSGAHHNPKKLTAAHPTLPHGTRVKVINLANNKEVVVTVNDRCRKRKIPVIDLSRAAAAKLGFLGRGAAKVMIIPLNT